MAKQSKLFSNAHYIAKHWFCTRGSDSTLIYSDFFKIALNALKAKGL